jgi:hypothetical protein
MAQHVDRAAGKPPRGQRQADARAHRFPRIEMHRRTGCLRGADVVRPVVKHVGHHHGEDDAQDDQPLGAQRHSGQLAHRAIIDEHQRAQDHQYHEDVLEQGIDFSQGLVQPEQPEIETLGVSAAPENQRTQKQHHEPAEDGQVSHARPPVAAHPLLGEGVAPGGGQAPANPIEPGCRCRHSQQTPTPIGRDGEHAKPGQEQQRHRHGAHGDLLASRLRKRVCTHDDTPAGRAKGAHQSGIAPSWDEKTHARMSGRGWVH